LTACDVLIVGGGPAGSTCAWKLTQAGLNVIVADKATFPRDKICAGWITPQVLETLHLDVADYSKGRVFQPIDSFYVGLFDQPGVEVSFDAPVSFGIRRCEFDHYLLTRSGASLQLGEPIKDIHRTPTGWQINGHIETRMVVGAGGHFCPVARMLRSSHPERGRLVTAVEIEFPATNGSAVPEAKRSQPRLYFRDDLSGYGWCVAKGDYLNIGVGLVDSKETASATDGLMTVLCADHSFNGKLPHRFHGHAYYLYDGASSPLLEDDVLLIGDAAGLAYSQSGEGIRPAIESGLLAALAILKAAGDYARPRLEPYRTKLVERLGQNQPALAARVFQTLPATIQRAIVRRLIRSPRFVRNSVILDGFLHARQPVLIG
jgi:flavin-dependent dehydrogenase